MVGAVLSTRFTLKVHEVLLPLASVAVSVTTVVPTPETEVPETGDCVIVTAEQLSDELASEV